MKEFLILLSITLTHFTSAGMSYDKTCMIDYLKRKEILWEIFPTKFEVSDDCQDYAARSYSTEEKYILDKIKDKRIERADCIITKLKESKLVEQILKEDVIGWSYATNSFSIFDLKDFFVIQAAYLGLYKVQAAIKEKLEAAASNCNSGTTYEGIFDKYLEIKNSSFTVLRRNFCVAKALLDSDAIELGSYNINPSKLQFSKKDCKEIMEKELKKVDENTRESLKQGTSMTEEEINQLIKTMNLEKFNHNDLAIEFLEQIAIPVSLLWKNKIEIDKRLRKNHPGGKRNENVFEVDEFKSVKEQV